MLIAVVLVNSGTGFIASPADADKYYIVDLSSRSVLSGPHNLPEEGPGLARLGALVFASMRITSGDKIFVVSRIGYEGFELLKSLGIDVRIFRGSLADLLTTGGNSIEKHVEPVKDCPCCGIRRR